MNTSMINNSLTVKITENCQPMKLMSHLTTHTFDVRRILRSIWYREYFIQESYFYLKRANDIYTLVQFS